ncbi:MAG: T9SS type A sorting domain-containing protein [Hymenobacter sp.]
MLTLRGSGFGSSRGSGGVDFSNADDGGATTTRALARDYLSWTDTQIQVRVPSSATGGHPAGTGPVTVTAADGPAATTATPLTLIYALINVESTAQTLADRPNHVATNATRGLTFRFSPNFRSNAAAGAAWQQGLAQWRCTTGINWELGPDAPANTIASDQTNVIAFDVANTLPARVLGRTTSYYAGCYNLQNEVVFYVSEIDQQFATSLPFQLGPGRAGAGQYDFESVAVHELGHAQQLAHLIRPGAIMHYAIGPGANLRVLDPASDVAGGRLVLRTRSFRNRGCGGPALLPAPLTALAAGGSGTGTSLAFSTRDECFLSGFVLERSAGLDTTAAAAGWQPVATAAAGQSCRPIFSLRPPAAGRPALLPPGPAPPRWHHRLRRPLPLTGGAAAELSLFPNPVVGDQLQLAYPAAAAGDLLLRFYNELGQYCRGQRASVPAGPSLLTLDVAGLRPGFYVLRLTDAQGSRSVKIIRQ